MCMYLGSTLEASSIDKDLYIKVRKDLDQIKNTRSERSLSRTLSNFLNILGFKEFDPYIMSGDDYCDVGILECDSSNSSNLEELMWSYRGFLTYTHYQIVGPGYDFILYQRIGGRYTQGCKCCVSLDFILSMMTMFITENVYLDYSDIEYLSGDIKMFYSFFIKSYKKNSDSSKKYYVMRGENSIMSNIRDEIPEVQEVEEMKNVSSVESVALCGCNSCLHSTVCKYRDSVPVIAGIEEPFTVSIECRYFLLDEPTLIRK